MASQSILLELSRQQALQAAFCWPLSAFDVGDKVGLATPSYPAYKNILAALGLHAVDIRLARSHFQPTPNFWRFMHPM